MKTIILSILLSCIGIAANAQVISDKARDELKGTVSSCTTKTYKAADVFGEIEKGELKSVNTVSYDKNGFKTSDSKYKYTNTYTPTGKISVIDRYENGVLDGKHRFEYQTGKVVETSYNESGNKSGTNVWTKSKRVKDGATTITYNLSGFPLKEVYKFDTGQPWSTKTWTYNAKGALSSLKSTYHQMYNQDSTITYSKYKYDAKGNWIYRVRSYNGDVDLIEEREITY